MITEPLFSTLLVIDRERHVPLGRLELSLPPSLVAKVLGRSPDVDRDNLVSWGRITPKDAESLVLADATTEQNKKLTERLDALASIRKNCAGRDTVWSLFFSESGRGQ